MPLSSYLQHIHAHTQPKTQAHPLCNLQYGLSVLSMAAWGNGARLSLSPTSQLNIESKVKCSTHWDNHDHTQSCWKVVYRQDSLDFRLRGRCNVTYLFCATGTSCLLSHTHANTDEHWQTCPCNYMRARRHMRQTPQTNPELHNVFISARMTAATFLCNRL